MTSKSTHHATASVPATEQETVNAVFAEMLRACTADGGVKRRRGEKPPWWCDPSHEAAIFSHLNRWKHGEKRDPDSGAHPLVHLAWRALSIAYQETHGQVDPALPDPVAPLAPGVIEMRSADTCVRLDCENFGGKLPCPEVA